MPDNQVERAADCEIVLEQSGFGAPLNSGALDLFHHDLLPPAGARELALPIGSNRIDWKAKEIPQKGFDLLGILFNLFGAIAFTLSIVRADKS